MTTKTNENHRHTTPTPKGKVQEERSKWRRLEQGEGKDYVDLAYKGPWIIDPRMDGPIAQPA